MDENMNESAMTIDLTQLYKLFKKNLRFVIISVVLFAVVAFAYTSFFVEKKYASQSSIFLVSKVNADTGTVDANALNANSKQVNNYMAMLKGENILTNVANQLDLNVGEVKNAVSVSNVADTEIIEIKAVSDNPEKSKRIVETLTSTFFKEVKETLQIENMTILNDPKVSNVPVSPNKRKNTVIGAMIGLLLSGGYIFLIYIFDKRLKTKQEVESYLGIPVLAEIPYYED